MTRPIYTQNKLIGSFTYYLDVFVLDGPVDAEIPDGFEAAIGNEHGYFERGEALDFKGSIDTLAEKLEPQASALADWVRSCWNQPTDAWVKSHWLHTVANWRMLALDTIRLRERWGEAELCCHGHFDCSNRVGGRCANEAHANAMGTLMDIGLAADAADAAELLDEMI